MEKGSTAEKILYDALDKIKTKNNEDPIKIFNTAISNVKPNLECRSRRVVSYLSSSSRSKSKKGTSLSFKMDYGCY